MMNPILGREMTLRELTSGNAQYTRARKLRQVVLQAPAVPVSLSIACAFNSEEQWMECLKLLASAQGRGDSGPNSMPAVQ